MGDIIRIENINAYTIEMINNILILTPKKQYISENELMQTSLTSSSIINCNIKNSNSNLIFQHKIV